MNYEDFKNEAIRKYAELPNETNDLYKKYYTEVNLPSTYKHANDEKAASAVKSLVANIEEKTGLKFDLVLSASFQQNNSDAIRLKKMGSIPEILENKIYKSSDNKLAAFINANANDAVVIETPPNASKKINMIFINDADISYECIFKLGEGSKLDIF